MLNIYEKGKTQKADYTKLFCCIGDDLFAVNLYTHTNITLVF